MLTKELIANVRRLEIRTRRIVDELTAGAYHSVFKGRGMEFDEVREYTAGDDIRDIDWNVTARYNEPFVKVFEEERELTLMLVVDVSGSEFFGTGNQFKREVLTEIAATLSFSALQNNDKVGLLLFSDQVELFIPPKKGKTHVLRIIRELLEFQPKSKKTDINTALEFLFGILKKKAIVFLLSDFMDDSYEKTLRIAAKKHDLTGIRVYDKREVEMPNIGLVPMLDSETQKTKWINTASKSVRNQYQKSHKEHVESFETLFRKNGAGTLHCSLEESYVKKLLSYFKARI